MTARRLLLATAVAAGAIASTIAPANAQTVRHLDASHDVVRFGAADTSPDGTAAPGRRQGDITWVRATYARHSLFVSMRFRSLSPTDRRQLHYFSIRTSAGKEREALVDSGKKYPAGKAVLTTRDSGYLHCRIGHRVSYRHAIVTVTIPSRCLGNARWVRVAYGEATDSWSPESTKPVFADDGYRSTALGPEDEPTYGPEVHRG
jgi:hypothetical protein